MSVLSAPPDATTPVTKPDAPLRVSRPKTGFWGRVRRDRVLLLLMVPGVLYFLVFHYGAIAGLTISLTEYKTFLGLAGSKFVGFANFERLLGNPDFWHAFLNTLYISFLQIVFFFPVPLALAMLLHSLTRSSIRRFVQSVVYLPHFISWVVVVALFQQMLGGAGVLNGMLTDSGMDPVSIIGNPDLFRPLAVFQVIWKEAGWGTIIVLAALANIDEQQYEAAAMDGATWWRRVWHVTLPALRPVIVLLLILRLGEILSVGFEQFFLQRTAVGPEVAEVVDTFVYFFGIESGDYGFGVAAGLFKGVVGVILIFAANKVAHRLGEQGVYSR